MVPAIPYTGALLAPSDAPLAYLGCAILLDWQKKLAKQTIVLPISARHKQPPLIQRGQRGVGGGQKRVRVWYAITTIGS